MVYIDMNSTEGELLPGIDLWKITKAEVAQAASSGNQMFKLQMERYAGGGDRLNDIIMLEGKGWAYGKPKLGTFVEEGFQGDVDPGEWIGQAIWVATKVEAYTTKDGKSGKSLKVDESQLSRGGYQRVDEVPPGKQPVVISDPPF